MIYLILENFSPFYFNKYRLQTVARGSKEGTLNVNVNG